MSVHNAVSLERKVAFLSDAGSYAEQPRTVERIETHMSWVFLTGHYVYKLKKPVVLPYLDFTTLESRFANCYEELHLNRRLAPRVYLDVVPLTLSPMGKLEVGGDGEPVEWLVKMRRLPQEKMLDQALADGRVGEADLRRFARVLSEFYRRSAPAMDNPDRYRHKLKLAIEENVEALGLPGFAQDQQRITVLANTLTGFVDSAQELIAARVTDGYVIEAHGDLRPEHICLTLPPVFIDCLEFSRELRTLDVADELAFLFLECERLNASQVGTTVLAEYSTRTGDCPAPTLMAFYKASRAMLRARLCLWHLLDGPPASAARYWTTRADDYLDRARRYAASL